MATSPDVLINDARNYAITVSSAATAALSEAMNTLSAIGQGSIGGKAPGVDLVLPTPGDPGTVPAYTGNRAKFEKFTGTKPTLDTIGPLNLPPDPGPAPSVETFNAPAKPNPWLDTSLLSGAPNIRTTFNTPTAPDLNVDAIPKPLIGDHDVPVAPVVSLPGFEGVRPTLADLPPSDLDLLMKAEFSTSLAVMRENATAQMNAFIDSQFPQFRAGIAALEERLATYLEGGSALSPAIENAIFNRTLDKTETDARRAIADSWGKGARAGFTLPPITLLAQIDLVNKDRRDNNARAANDIAIKQAELEQSNLQFAVTQSINLRQFMLQSALTYFTGLIQINGQALQYAREVVDSVVRAYELAVRYSELSTRIYESEATVYRARLDGALAVVQVYEAEIRALQSLTQVDEAKVSLYRAQLDAVQAEANVYRTQVEALQAEIGVEKLKVDLYGSKVQSFVAQVNGYTAEWQGYAAAVSGESAKISASAERVRAYGAQVQAYEARVRAQATEIESRTRINTQKLESYRTDVEAYKALNEATLAAVNSEIASYSETIRAFVAKANAISEKSRSEVAIYEVAQRGLIEGARLTFQYIQERDNINVARARGASEIASAIGSIYAGIAQSTLAGMNALAASTEATTA